MKNINTLGFLTRIHGSTLAVGIIMSIKPDHLPETLVFIVFIVPSSEKIYIVHLQKELFCKWKPDNFLEILFYFIVFIVASSEKMYIVHQQEELFCHAQDSCGPSFPGKLKILQWTKLQYSAPIIHFFLSKKAR